jgi:hypothetical protein
MTILGSLTKDKQREALTQIVEKKLIWLGSKSIVVPNVNMYRFRKKVESDVTIKEGN